MFKLTKIGVWSLIMAVITIVVLPTDAFAAFESLTNSGRDIFVGLKSIIYPGAAIGIVCVCIGGFFGNINFKWVAALFIGLVVIACCGKFIEIFTGEGNNGGIESVATLNGE